MFAPENYILLSRAMLSLIRVHAYPHRRGTFYASNGRDYAFCIFLFHRAPEGYNSPRTLQGAQDGFREGALMVLELW